MVPWKAAALPRWIATKILWNKNAFSRCTPVILNNFFAISERNWYLHYKLDPAFHCNWYKMVLIPEILEYFLRFLSAAASAIQLPPCGLRVQGMRGPKCHWLWHPKRGIYRSSLLHGISVRPSGLRPFSPPPSSIYLHLPYNWVHGFPGCQLAPHKDMYG